MTTGMTMNSIAIQDPSHPITTPLGAGGLLVDVDPNDFAETIVGMQVDCGVRRLASVVAPAAHIAGQRVQLV